ncbi:MAG TPA: LuxR C-terminal-related transcriptional regulator [Saprospiraceae bacterium]|nr:LuxR C-terminal-related transcriptional regulator [Saprospiraceae bacterium]
MQFFELILLGFTYTSLAIALFLQILCFKRKIENAQTIVFTLVLLLLVISISLSPLSSEQETTTISTLICMVLVSAATFSNTLSERQHNLKPIFSKLHLITAGIILLGIPLAKWFDFLFYFQSIVVVFLIVSILMSMIIVRTTKPIKRYEHLEQADKIFALIFLILVPVYLIYHFFFEKEYQHFQIAFILYMAFTALAVSKIYDDLKRLSLLNKNLEPQIQHFKNYGLTPREEEIAGLLLKGFTYQNIGEQLFISIPTVKTHASNIYKKCGVNSRNELTYLLTN